MPHLAPLAVTVLCANSRPVRSPLAIFLVLPAAIAQAQLPPCDVVLTSTPITCPTVDDGTLTVVSHSGGPYNYSWSHDATETGATVANLPPGPYTVVIDDGGGCETIIDTLLTEPIIPPLGTLTSTGISCAGANDGTLTFTVDPGPYQWSWTHAPGVGATTLTNMGPGVYSVIITGGPPPCPSIVTLGLGDPGVRIDGEVDYCPSDPPVLTAAFDWGFQPDQIVWSTGETTPVINVAEGTIGIVSVTATDTTIGCVVTAQVNLTELPAPFVAYVSPDTVCMNVGVVVNTIATDADSLVWRWGGFGFSNVPDPTVAFPQAGWQPISLQGFDLFDCGSAPLADSIYVRAQVPAIFTAMQLPCTPMVEIVLGSTADSCAFFIGDSLVTHACSGFISWDFGRYNIYDFTLYATESHHCDDTLAVTIDVRTEPTLFLANAFTPNDDGINDLWPDHVEIPEIGFELNLYDRWGASIWSTKNPLEQWDGAGLPMGVYVYTMQMRDPCSATDEIVKAGHVTLFR